MYAKELRRWSRLRAARSLPALFRVLPEPAGRLLCVWFGRAGHLLVARDRHLARANLARVYPEWSPERIRIEARRVFEEIGRNAYDFLRFPGLDPRARGALVAIEGEEILEGVRREGRGAILVTGHLGSWEVLAAALAGRGWPLRAMARPLREPRLDRALREHRARMGVPTISSEVLPVAAVRHLRSGGFLGILADQRVKRGGVTVRFLGQATRMTDGPARLALASGAPLVPLGIHRRPDHTHCITVLPPVAPAGGPGAAAALTQAVAGALESLIRLHPEQWIWIHPRWGGAGGTAAEASAAGLGAAGEGASHA